MSFLLKKIYSEILKNKGINISNSFIQMDPWKRKKKGKKAETCRRGGRWGLREDEKGGMNEWVNEWMVSTKQWEKVAVGRGERTWECFELVVQSAIVRNIKIRFTVERLPLLRYVKYDWHHRFPKPEEFIPWTLRLILQTPKEACLFYYLKLLLGQ